MTKSLEQNHPSKHAVLMVCDSYPPQADVGGLRPAMFSKYLPEFGWDPIIFTRVRPSHDPLWNPTLLIEGLPDEEKRTAVNFGSEDIQKALSCRTYAMLVRDFLCPDYAHPPGLVDEMIRKVNLGAVDGHPPQVVWATAPPLGCLTVASCIARRHSVPWIADFRDIIEQDKGSTTSLRAILLYYRMLRRRYQVARSAAAAITVSPHHAEALQRKLRRKVYVIPNGFDPEMFFGLSSHAASQFSVVYMGRILSEWLRNPLPFFEGVDRWLHAGNIDPNRIEISFYGTDPIVLKQLVAPFQCKRLVSVKPRVTYNKVPQILQQSCILLLLTNRGRHGILTTKVFEYLAVRRPILCVPGDGNELDALLQRANAGVIAQDAAIVARVLDTWYQEWCTTGTVGYQGRENVIMAYSRRTQADALAKLLNEVVFQN